MRRSRKKRSKTVTAAQALPKPTQEPAKALQAGSDNAPEAIAGDAETARISEQAAKMENLMGSVRRAVSDDPALVAGVVRNWLEERPS
jgi:flagellar biosynthesis/type III secretory pathway M-ring protein FliF/YscJ